jgi:hypothetical protein
VYGYEYKKTIRHSRIHWQQKHKKSSSRKGRGLIALLGWADVKSVIMTMS